jgi:hypothetical protein
MGDKSPALQAGAVYLSYRKRGIDREQHVVPLHGRARCYELSIAHSELAAVTNRRAPERNRKFCAATVQQ